MGSFQKYVVILATMVPNNTTDIPKIESLVSSMHVILVIAFPLAFGIAAVSTPFTYYFFSIKFMPVAPLMAVEAIVVIPISIASAIGVQYLIPTDQVKPYTVSVI